MSGISKFQIDVWNVEIHSVQQKPIWFLFFLNDAKVQAANHQTIDTHPNVYLCNEKTPSSNAYMYATMASFLIPDNFFYYHEFHTVSACYTPKKMTVANLLQQLFACRFFFMYTTLHK